MQPLRLPRRYNMLLAKYKHNAIRGVFYGIFLFPILSQADSKSREFPQINDATIQVIMASQPTWEDDFEQGWNAVHGRGSLNNRSDKAKKWRYSQMQTDQAGLVILDPKTPNNHVMQFMWQQGAGKQYDANTQKKAHLYSHFGQHNKQEEIWAFQIYFPEQGMEKDNQSEILVQWHAQPDRFESDRRPPIALDNRNDQLTVTWLYDQQSWSFPGLSNRNSRHITLGKTPKNQWISFVFHIKWDPNGAGMLRVWQDGNLKINQSNIAIGFNDQVGPYLGFGIYKFSNQSQYPKRRILFDNLRFWRVDSSKNSHLK